MSFILHRNWIEIETDLSCNSSTNMLKSMDTTLRQVSQTHPQTFTRQEWKAIFAMLENLHARNGQEQPHTPWLTSIRFMCGAKKLVVCNYSWKSVIKSLVSAPCRWVGGMAALALVGWASCARRGVKHLLYPERLLLAGGPQVLDMNCNLFSIRGESGSLVNVNFSIVKVL
jgi:hypothetical protein